MARAKALADEALYERDFCLWLEQQAALLRERRFDELDLANLIEEIEAMARRTGGGQNNLIVLLMHLLKYQYQPEQRSSSWRGSVLSTTPLRDDLRRARAFGRMRQGCSPAPTRMPASKPAWRPGCR